MTGKEKCKQLRQIRKEIAEKNGIDFHTTECTYEGECKGTCPACERELRYLENELNKKSVNEPAVYDTAAADVNDKEFEYVLSDKKISSETIKSVVLGFAVGDALGVPVEFQSREELSVNSVSDYRDYGTYNVPAGIWSDDTSMTLASLDSLARRINFTDIMKKFISWADKAEYTATNEVFDIGVTTSAALQRFKDGTPALNCGSNSESDNGNGSLMRIIPAVFYVKYKLPHSSIEQRMDVIHNISTLTHSHPRSKMACGIYAFVLMGLLESGNKHMIKNYLLDACKFYKNLPEYKNELEHFDRLFSSDFDNSGYVVAALEAAIWCVLNTESYSECVLKAVNLGNDTDTIGAIAGGLAGCIYGLNGIPESWLEGLQKREYIEDLCDAFVGKQSNRPIIMGELRAPDGLE